jgi:D-alanyl-D-alanine carboxypeptidase
MDLLRPVRLLAASVGLALLASTGCAQPAPGGSSGLRPTLEDWRGRSGAPAAVLAVDGPGITWTGSSGTRHPGTGAAVTVEDQFRVASITKLFVATVVLQLAEEEQIDLADPLADYLPDFPRAEEITLSQLLNHTSGVPDYTQVEGFGRRLFEERDRVWTPAEVLAVAAEHEAEFEPGTGYAYSNTNFVLLGEVVRVATGSSWTEQVRTRILDPLELRDTYVAGTDDAADRPPVVPAYFDVDGDGAQENVETGGPRKAEETAEGAAGAMVSTVGDLMTFGDALFRGRLLEDTTVAAMAVGRTAHPRTAATPRLEIQRRDTAPHPRPRRVPPGFAPRCGTCRAGPARGRDGQRHAWPTLDDLAELAYRSVLTGGAS